MAVPSLRGFLNKLWDDLIDHTRNVLRVSADVATLDDTDALWVVVNAAIDNEIIGAPGVGHRILVYSFVVQNESANPTVMVLRSGAGHNGWRVLGQNQGDGLEKTFPSNAPWRLGDNEALNLNLDGANQCSVSVQYRID